MKLNAVERAAMNNPLRAAHQHHVEAGWFRRLAGGSLAGQHVLEMGCGRGVGAEVLLDRLGAGQVHGVRPRPGDGRQSAAAPAQPGSRGDGVDRRRMRDRAAGGEHGHSRRVAAGDALLAPSITRRLISEFASRPDPHQPVAALAELTDRERDILSLVARGMSDAEIAGHLVISPLTAKSHVRNILRKLDCHDRAALAYENGVIAPGERHPSIGR